MHVLGSVGGRVVQIGDLTHDLHLSIFPSLVSDRRSEPIINRKRMTAVYLFASSQVHI